MIERQEVQNLEGLLEEIVNAGDDPGVLSIGDIERQLGRRSFGPLLLVAAIPPMTPLATIPGLASIMATIILLTSFQLLIGLPHLWLPEALRSRSISREAVQKAVRLARPVARAIDKLIRPRLISLTQPPFVYLMALCSALLALTMPPLELVPMTSGIPAFPVAAFGLALVARDGLFVIVGFTVLALSAAGVVAVLAALL